MFTPGSVYFIKLYDYEDGGTPSDKLLIVVCVNDKESILLRALTTSKLKIPVEKVFHGCTSNQNLSFFTFLKGRVIGKDLKDRDFSFDKDTFIFFKDNMEIISCAKLLGYYPNRISLIGELNLEVYQRLVKCIKSSKLIAKKYKTFLLENLSDK